MSRIASFSESFYTYSMNQFELNFDASTPEERLSQLKKDYLDKVGVHPRTNDPGVIEAALLDPVTERARLALLDCADDRDDLKRPYTGRS